MPVIAPSILAANFASLESDIRKVESAGATMIHVDVMDGHFVPNLTIGPPVIKALRRATKLELDVHLMISNPEEMVDRYLDAGADYVTVHYEAARHLDLILNRIRQKGVKAGVVLNPHTPVGVVEEVLHLCDLVLLMSVNPGFGGQEFISYSFEKVRKLRTLILEKGLGVQIEIDGGISLQNTAAAVRAGVDILVAGTAVFRADDPGAAFLEMTRIAREASTEA